MAWKSQHTCVALIPLTNETWSQISVDEVNLAKQMLPEGLRYYTTGLLWLRILQLKRANSQKRTAAEEKVLELCDTTTSCVPQPIHIYLQGLGAIKCSSTGQTIIPEFPPLPTEEVEGFGGYFGGINDNTHILYEEFPTLGVRSEGLRVAMGVAPPGDYASALALPNAAVNSNLLGYHSLQNRRHEAQNVFLNIGINAQEFHESVENRGFNFDLMYTISDWVSSTKTFKIEHLHLANFSLKGSQAQTIITRPTTTAIHKTANINGDLVATSLSRESVNIFGLANYLNFQMLKESAENDIVDASIRSHTWCCVSFTGVEDSVLPFMWTLNQNIRRNLPAEYMVRRFETISVNESNLRKRVIRKMVIPKR